ncbi:hypothetical protein [Streptomyces sp. NPDC058739]|uniref:hypothetical protein n=1 Tax=Streptomyces sp. NPDC058739 TaxID=3346618 RepID=UPI00369F330A
MTAPPEESRRTNRPGPGPEPGQVDDKILGLASAGLSVRRIAAEVGLPKSTVQDRLSGLLRTRTQRASAEFVAMREVRLEDLFRRAYASLAGAEKGSDTWSRAWDRCIRAEESLRKLKGADAPEAMTIALERRVDEEATDVAEVLLKVIPEVLEAAGLDLGRQGQLTRFGLELAGWYLRSVTGEDPGPRPERPRLAIAELEPGPSAGASEDAPPPAPTYPRQRDSADDVLAQLAAIQDEFGDLLDEEDDDGPEGDQEAVA